jgi:hypothetical protein
MQVPPDHVIDFVGRYGQSLDWLFRGNPTAMLRMLAVQSERRKAQQ